jgi:Zn-finger nucleic acid-binding protein
MKPRTRFVCGLLIALALWAGWSARTFVAIDHCLDGGGVWSSRGECEGRFSEP